MIVCCGKDSLIIFYFLYLVREKKKKKLNVRKMCEMWNECVDIESVLKVEVEYKMYWIWWLMNWWILLIDLGKV